MSRRSRFMTNTLVMTAGALAIRLINLSFRAWLFVRLGARAVGEYQLLMMVFFLAVTSCTAGFGFAVTRTVAEGGNNLRQSMGISIGLSLVAGGVLWLTAPVLGAQLLGGTETIAPLRLLTLGLTPIAIASCLRGYFVARRRTVLPAIGDLAELGIAIVLTVWLCDHIDPLLALAIGSVVGDLMGCAIMVAGYLSLRRRHDRLASQTDVTSGALAHIAAPVWLGSMGRGALSGLENLLIPRGLSQWGGGDGQALAQYGAVTGMVFPVLFLPLCVLTNAAMLLVPELAEMKVHGHSRSIETAAKKSIELTLWFSFLTAAVVMFGADDIGIRFFASSEAGQYLRLMSPIIPILYLDSVVDGMLKGLDQQAYSFRYNIIDGVMRVGMAWLLIPAMGVSGYFLMLYLSEILNCALSFGRLIKVARVRVDIIWWLVAPAMAGITLYLLLTFAGRVCGGL